MGPDGGGLTPSSNFTGAGGPPLLTADVGGRFWGPAAAAAVAAAAAAGVGTPAAMGVGTPVAIGVGTPVPG